MSALDELNALKKKFLSGEIHEAEYYAKARPLAKGIREGNLK